MYDLADSPVAAEMTQKLRQTERYSGGVYKKYIENHKFYRNQINK